MLTLAETSEPAKLIAIPVLLPAEVLAAAGRSGEAVRARGRYHGLDIDLAADGVSGVVARPVVKTANSPWRKSSFERARLQSCRK